MSTTKNTIPLSPARAGIEASEFIGRLMSVLAHDGVITVKTWNAEIMSIQEDTK